MPPIHGQALRARLEKLDIEILRQKKLLKNLKQDRIIARRQLNAALDPIARLPLEISSEIFFLCLPTGGNLFPQPGALRLPMLLLNICNSWRRIAESTSSLWATIHIPSRDSAQGLEELVPLWLTRARNRLLSISLSGDASFDPKVVSTVWSHGPQVKHLEMCEVEYELGGSGDPGWAMNLWEGRVGPGPLPALETLVIRGLHMARPCRFPSHQILELLRLAPNLVECVFSDVEVEFAPVARRTGGRLVLPNLRRLVFDELEVKRGTPFSCGVLDHLALPALEALVVNVGGAELLSFLMESSPPLRELVVTDPGNFSLLVRCLRLVPRLHQLELWGFQSDLAEHFFNELAVKSPSPLFPQLSMLVFHFDADEDLSTVPESFWPAALHALRARRPRLRVVNFEVAERIPPPPMPKIIIDGLRELAADKMKVCIRNRGTHGRWRRTFV